MATMIDIAKASRGRATARAPVAAAMSVRYGTALGSCEAGEALSVLLDGSEDPVTLLADSPVTEGERVRVVFQGGSYAVVALSTLTGRVAAAAASGDAAKEAADEAKAAADAARTKADELSGQLDDVTVTVSGLDGKIGELSTKVEGTASDASAALTAATEAKQTAASIETTASTALTAASSALTQSTEAKQTAESVKSTAQSAYEDAQTALKQASSAEQTANGIKTTVEESYVSKEDGDVLYASKTTFEQTAEGFTARIDAVSSTAGTAKEAADTAAGMANDALSAANDAAGAASAATDASDSATAAANDASVVAAAAAKTAGNAAKTATNYLAFSTEGLVVGDMTAETLGSNTRIRVDGIDLRDGTDVAASFEKNAVVLGANSENTHIWMGANENPSYKRARGFVDIYTDGDSLFLMADGPVQIMPFLSGTDVAGLIVGTSAVRVVGPLACAGKAVLDASQTRSFADGTVKCYKHAGLCSLSVNNYKATAALAGSKAVGTLPAGWRPPDTFKAALYAHDTAVGMVYVLSDGTVNAYAEGMVAGTLLSGNLVWPAVA